MSRFIGSDERRNMRQNDDFAATFARLKEGAAL
ncbi:hypothetical protein T190_27395 [Sinorhizobium meliloti CCBAU 01290]|nr:hypothetical protein T190_27395 [Sinorhizobium meliloti CCBAU 01290]